MLPTTDTLPTTDSAEPAMHIHVLGLGSIGCLISHHLRRALPAKHGITLIHKTIEARQYLTDKRIIRVEHRGEITESSGFLNEAFSNIEEGTSQPTRQHIPEKDAMTRNSSPIHSLFVTLKAQQVAGALDALAPRLSENSTIVLLQNGLGVYDEVISKVFRNPQTRPHFVFATNNHGAFVKYHYHISHAGMGTIDFGIVSDPMGRDFERGLREESEDAHLRLVDITANDDPQFARYASLRDSVAALLLLTELQATWRPIADVHHLMQRKLAVNAVVNPITALMGCRNGEVFQMDAGRDLLQKVSQEASAVFEAQRRLEHDRHVRELKSHGVLPLSADLPFEFPPDLSAESLTEESLRVASRTAGNISSMLQDIRRGKDTEIDYINGYLVDMGQEYGVPTPVNQTLRDLVKLRKHIPIEQHLR